jgi:hypothetical protein
MRRIAKTKIGAARVLPRKAKVVAAASARRAFPAWIDASDRGVAFSAVGVTPRVRDGLVLRLVARKKKIVATRRTPDGPGAR